MGKSVVYASFGLNLLVLGAVIVAVASAWHNRPLPPVNSNVFSVHGTTMAKEADGRRTIRGTVENKGYSVSNLKLAYSLYGSDGGQMAICYIRIGALERGKAKDFVYPVSDDTEGYSLNGFVTESQTYLH